MMRKLKMSILVGAAVMTIAAAPVADASITSTGSAGETSQSDGGSTGGTPVPEPSNLLMLGFGVAGLIAGRLVARRRKSKF